MKKLIFLSTALFLSTFLFSKKVKFEVDMRGVPISIFGMHISGDFQTLAGFAGGDWMPNTTLLSQDINDTNLYNIIVDIPAFKKYEFKFVNGDQFYEAEFVPIESRVGYNFNDNRWIYIDSIANDTTQIGAIMFSRNAPVGFYLIRFKLDMRNELSINATGVHVGISYLGWDTTRSTMYSLNDTVLEVISYIDTLITSVQFKYLNGNSPNDYEIVPVACANVGNRDFQILKDTVFASVCFSQCSACVGVGITDVVLTETFNLFPNPTNDFVLLQFENNTNRTVSIFNALGKNIASYSNFFDSSLRIDKRNLGAGIYFISITNSINKTYYKKLVIQ